MGTMTLSVPKELKNKMESFPELNWSEVARQAFMQKIEDLEFLERFKSKSSITENDAMKMGLKLSKSLAKKYN